MPGDPVAVRAYSPEDRVRILVRPGVDWTDAKIRRRAGAGRPGTVVRVIGTALPPKQRSYTVCFDRAGRERELVVAIDAQDLEPVATA